MNADFDPTPPVRVIRVSAPPARHAMNGAVRRENRYERMIRMLAYRDDSRYVAANLVPGKAQYVKDITKVA